MRTVVVKPLGEAGRPWVLVYEGTAELASVKCYKWRPDAVAAADEMNVSELEYHEVKSFDAVETSAGSEVAPFSWSEPIRVDNEPYFDEYYPSKQDKTESE